MQKHHSSIAPDTAVPSPAGYDKHLQVYPVKEKDSTRKPVKPRPFLFRFRSARTFIFWTAATGLFTSTFVHSILFPLSPFIVSRIKNGDDINQQATYDITEESISTSRDTGILVALYAVGLLSGSPFFGWLGDKIKQRRIPMLLGILASIAANIMFMFSTMYWMLLVARFLQGVSNACVWTMCLCLIADNYPSDQLGLQMGKLVGFYPLGMMVGLPSGGVLYSKLGYQAPFIASMIFCVIDLLMRLIIIERSTAPREWFMQDDEVEDVMNDTCSSLHEDLKLKITWFQLIKQPRLIVSLLLTVVVATVMSGFEPTLSMRLASEWHFDAAACGLILIAYMVPSIISSAVCGWLCDKFGTKIVAIVSLVLAIPACIAMGIPTHETSFWPLIPMLAMGGITIAGCQSPVFPEIARAVAAENKSSNDRDGLARSYALFNAAYGTGMCLGPFMAGFIYGSIGFFWLCVTLSTMFVGCIPLVFIYLGDKGHLIKRKQSSTEGNDNSKITVSHSLSSFHSSHSVVA
ncbi:major facilitator superfamily domain-containing protein [Radiomyces spectabilis]|uniref:major facilitator superfamily domain-containing protein n=1 Tax=Radiomyces spectabilis TaxID=64574 RepID=UPI00221EE591|nr:major facilitator superfamily domain-containing protein [Radiomyces spectabilis]KAI8374429.1 major facilitator superfamily domain-containing protein [Radiomyces spectabilis]